MEFTVQEELMAQMIGREILKILKQEDTLKRMASEAEGRALEALEEIRRVLDDDTGSDPECFRRVEAILAVLEKSGTGSSRHDW